MVNQGPIIVTGAAGFVGRELLGIVLSETSTPVVGADRDMAGVADHPRLRKVSGDIADRAIRDAMLADGCGALVHLATVPGGAAEADPAASRRINIDAMYDLLEDARAAGGKPRVVYASSIAVLGDPLPTSGVNDATPLAPRMVYGGHKAMMETAVAMMHHRDEIEGVTVRLPGILARPKGPSGMKSAFMSDIFHALRQGEPFTCPVSPAATIWAQSVERCARNLIHAIDMDSDRMPVTRAVTLPALRMDMQALAREIAAQTGASADNVTYRPDPALEAAFGAYPPLTTTAAEQAGFAHDGNIANLVRSALNRIAPSDMESCSCGLNGST